MDPIYAHAQVQHTVWANPVHSVMPMDYSTYPHPPPFTSPPATPMTPITPVTLHHAFPMPHQYEMTAPGTVYHNPPPPPPPPFPSPPEFSHPDYRLYALCQHLQNYSKVQESQQKAWWEEFLSEFFQENATLVIEVDFGEGTRKYRLTGDWIGLYFKSLLENGVISVHLNLDQCYTTPNQNLWQLECQNAVMETHHSTPKPTKVCMSGSLVVDFSLEEKPRIISWYFHIKDHIEYVPRSAVGQGEESGIMGNITCRGILPATQKLLLEAGMLENTGYHESTSIAMTSTATPTINTAMHWQESVPPLIHHPQHLDVLGGPMGVMGGAVLSPDPRMNQSMNGNSAGNNSSGGKQHHPKSSRSSSHHGGSGKKKSSPIPSSSSHGGGSNAGKELFVLVAAEAMPLSSAEDFMSAYSIDERTITRVNNKGKSRAESADISKNGHHHIINGQTGSSSGSAIVGGGKVAPHITHLPRPDACLPDGGAAQDGITSSPTDGSWSTPTDTLAISVTSTR